MKAQSDNSIISIIFRNSVISIIIAVVATMLGVVIDGIVIGHFLGPECMAAYGLFTPVMNLATIFSSIMAAGTQVVCAQRLGAGDEKGARRSFSICIIFTLIISAVLLCSLLLFRTKLAVFLGARGNSAHLLPLLSEYILGVSFSLPAVIILLESNSLLRLDDDATRIVFAVGTMTILDIAGDLLNALVFRGGMLGMGLATTFSYLVALIIVLFHFTKKDIIFRFSAKGLDLNDLKDILMTGSSSAVGSASTTLRNYTLNQIMVATILSSTAVGALGVLSTIQNCTSCILIGVGMTTSMIGGIILGEQDRIAAEKLLKTAFCTAFCIALFLAVVIFIFAGHIAGVFGNSDSTQMTALAARGLRIFSLSIVLYGINNAFSNFSQGLRQMKISNLCEFLQNFLYVTTAALLLKNILDTDAVWFAYLIGESCTLLTIVIMAAVRKKGLPSKIKDFIFIKEPFGAPDSEILELSISDSSQVIPASFEVSEFCQSKGTDSKKKLLLSLFVEELGNNVVTHGFSDSKTELLEIRLVHMDNDWILRLRDNCKAFDPTEWIKLHENDDPTSNIGIRMVCGMAKDVGYVNTLDLNILTLKI
ncbi:MATE family efflux transporter [Butyrivibrio sp. JL13D10]|uniref:MATE family efflux transporter n=1 Tax=Butyrivibrio sp. JL13D10 TaxID=3236815 RepID=UPI0038B47F75